MIVTAPGGDTELAGQLLTMPLKHSSPDTHCSHLDRSVVYLYPGLHTQALIELEPTGEV